MPAAMTGPEIALEAELRKVPRPPELEDAIAAWEVSIDTDWAGEPAVHVKVVLKDSALQRAWPHRAPFRDALQNRAWELYPDRFPYVGFASESVGANPEPRPPVRRKAR